MATTHAWSRAADLEPYLSAFTAFAFQWLRASGYRIPVRMAAIGWMSFGSVRMTAIASAGGVA